MQLVKLEGARSGAARYVTAIFDDGTVRTCAFGQVEVSPGVWALPDPALVAKEVRALVQDVIRTSFSEGPAPDPALQAELDKV